MPFDKRAEIARGIISISAPVGVGLLAIVIATLTLFALLANEEFRRMMPRWGLVLGSFLWSVTAVIVTLLFSLAFLVGTYVGSFVASKFYVPLGALGIGLTVYSVLLTLLGAENIARQIIGMAMLDRRR